MKGWLSRLALGTLLFVLLLAMLFPVVAFTLATKGQILIGSQERAHVRIFMVRTEQEKGLGLERSWNYPDKQHCYKTAVNYLLWEGGQTGQDTVFCHCIDADTGYRQFIDPC